MKMMQKPSLDVYPYWEFVKRRKWWIIVPFFFVLMIGATYIYVTPKLYKASTLVLLEDQSISESYVGTASGDSLENRLQLITQKINSRSNLKSLLDSYDLDIKRYQNQDELLANLGTYLSKLPFISEGQASLDYSDSEKTERLILEQLRKKIEVQFSSEDNRAFEISFLWNDPVVAAEFANEIANQFIEQNSLSRKKKASGATEFLSMEVAQLRNQLSQKEKELEEFRKNNIGRLPEQLDANIDLMNQKREELNTLNERLELEKQRAMMLSDGIRRGTRIPIGSSEDDELSNLIQELEAMKSKYTSKHPDVFALQSRIENYVAQGIQENSSSDTRQSASPGITPGDSDYSYRGQLSQTQAQIESYQQQILNTRQELREYQQRVEETPHVETQLRDLQRDYETLDDRYQDILSRKLNAQMAEELERRQKGEQFTVIDSAIPPLVPFEPDVRKLGLMTLLLGLSFGGGLAYLRESMDPAFFSAEDAESYLGRKVLVTLPWHSSKDS